MKKNKQLNVRVEQKDLDLIDYSVKEYGFDNRSQYLMSLVEKDNVLESKYVEMTELELVNANLTKLFDLYDTRFLHIVHKDMFATKRMLALILAYLKSNFKQSKTRLNDVAVKETKDFIEAKEIEFEEKYGKRKQYKLFDRAIHEMHE